MTTLARYNVLAEQTVLGTYIVRPDLALRQGLAVTDFDEARGHHHVFGAVLDQADRGVAGSFQTLVHDLEATGTLDSVGDGDLSGVPYLIRLRELGERSIPDDAETGRRQIKVASTYREATLVLRRAMRALENPDHEAMLDDLAQQSTLLDMLVNDTGIDGDRPLPGLRSVQELMAMPDPRRQWVIPELLERQDRVLLVGEEGEGKSTLGRQVALCGAAGIHPFVPSGHYPAVRTLIVDFENSASQVRRSLAETVRRIEARGVSVGDRCRIWNWPAGVDIRAAGGRSMLIRAIEQSSPALIVIGPLYKMAEPRRGESWEEQAAQTAHAIDSLRQRYNVAFWIEHHMPKAQDGRRVDPVGSGLWKRWPEFGLRLDTPGPKDDPLTYTLGRFRKDRDVERRFPDRLKKFSSGLPWEAVFDHAADVQDIGMACEEASGQ